MRYPGGKSRCFQKLIELIPPHRVYIETHLGGGAVLRHKKPAQINIGIDKDPELVEKFRRGKFRRGFRFVAEDAIAFLARERPPQDAFIFADPPYLASTRRSTRSPYRYDYLSDDHRELLRVLKSFDCAVMVTSYPNDLYAEELRGWHRIDFEGSSHVGRRNECVWLNYTPALLHDTRYIGWDFRGRQSWKRKCARWRRKFSQLSMPEQQCLLSELQNVFHHLSPQS